jgi:predicted transcriptional regulator
MVSGLVFRLGPNFRLFSDSCPRKRNTNHKESIVTLREVKDILDAEVLVGQEQLDKEVKTAFGADLMSDVLAFAKAGSLLLTGLTNPQVVRTSDVLDIAAIILVRGKKPSPETMTLAEELKIPILTTKFILFETAGRLYERGIVGCMERVDEERARS